MQPHHHRRLKRRKEAEALRTLAAGVAAGAAVGGGVSWLLLRSPPPPPSAAEVEVVVPPPQPPPRTLLDAYNQTDPSRIDGLHDAHAEIRNLTDHRAHVLELEDQISQIAQMMLGLEHNLTILNGENADLQQSAVTTQAAHSAEKLQNQALAVEIARLTKEKDQLAFNVSTLQEQLRTSAMHSARMLGEKRRVMGASPQLWKHAISSILPNVHRDNAGSGRSSPASSAASEHGTSSEPARRLWRS